MVFLDIIDIYSGTKSANLAQYYLGVSYLNLGEYELAVEALDNFSSDDVMLSSISLGATGDAYMQMGQTEEALSYYDKAAHNKENKFTTPIYLMKAGGAAEELNNYSAAVAYYEEIKKDYLDTPEGQDIDKFLSRASALVE